MQAAERKNSLWKKIHETLLCILVGAGIMYFYDLFKNLNADKLDQLFIVIGFGIVQAYYLDYKSPIKKEKG